MFQSNAEHAVQARPLPRRCSTRVPRWSVRLRLQIPVGQSVPPPARLARPNCIPQTERMRQPFAPAPCPAEAWPRQTASILESRPKRHCAGRPDFNCSPPSAPPEFRHTATEFSSRRWLIIRGPVTNQSKKIRPSFSTTCRSSPPAVPNTRATLKLGKELEIVKHLPQIQSTAKRTQA